GLVCIGNRIAVVAGAGAADALEATADRGAVGGGIGAGELGACAGGGIAARAAGAGLGDVAGDVLVTATGMTDVTGALRGRCAGAALIGILHAGYKVDAA